MQRFVAQNLLLLGSIAAIALIVLAAFAVADDTPDNLLRSIEFYEDETAALTIDAVQSIEFQQSENLVTAGYTNSAYWFRLHVLPAASGDEVVLFVRPPTLDSITLYQPDPELDGVWQEERAGVRYGLQQHEWVSTLRGFRLAPAKDGSVYFLRVTSIGTVTINASAHTSFDAHRLGLKIDISQITYLAVMLVLMLWSLRMALITQETLFWWFAALQIVWVFHSTIYFGYVTILLPSFQQDWVFTIFRAAVIGFSMITIAFHKSVLVRFEPHPIAVRLFDLLLFVMGTAFVLFWAGRGMQAMTLNAYCIAASPFVFMINAFTTRKTASPGLLTMRVIYTTLSITLLFWVMSLLGIFNIGIWSLYGTVIHGLSTGILMFSILHLHGRNLIAEAQEARATLSRLTARQGFEQEQNRTLGRFIEMLGHETKNAMSVINMSVAAPAFGERQKARVADAIRALNTLIDRCNQTMTLDSNTQSVQYEACDPVAILHEIRTTSVGAERIHLQCPPDIQIETDPVLLRVILSNLMENAVKYSAPRSDILIKVENNNGSNVTIWVENDEGPAGHPDPDRVFQKYYRHHRAKSDIGSGLGLYLVKSIARLLGGNITYEPEGSRIRFRLLLPC